MSAKPIYEVDAKAMLVAYLHGYGGTDYALNRSARITPDTDWDKVVADHPWLKTEKLVAKPDQLIKRRGKLGLIAINVDYEEAKAWIQERMMKTINIGRASGTLHNFVIEPLIKHEQKEEFYLSFYSTRTGDNILFYHEGGIDVGDVDAKAEVLPAVVGEAPTDEQLRALVSKADPAAQDALVRFIGALYKLYAELHYTYLEINPLVYTGGKIHVLDVAAKIDQTADFEVGDKWGQISFPPPFGRDATPEEAYIAELDAKSGASLKLTVLNPKGRIWTMVAGGGASVIYADTIVELGGADDLANYGEYSGAPSESQTFEYAKTILDLMTREKDERGKILIVGGGIANFTNVAATFKGIVRALQEYKRLLVEHGVSIYVRRAGPNYQEGLRIMRELGGNLGVPIQVYGPETHMTAIVAYALGKKQPQSAEFLTDGADKWAAKRKSSGFNMGEPAGTAIGNAVEPQQNEFRDHGRAVLEPEDTTGDKKPLFTNETRAIVFGMQPRAVQGMLDFDHMCKRSKPSVAAMVYPFSGNHMQKFYWGSKEIMVPVFKSMAEALKKFPEVDTMINFASFRSATEATMEGLQFPQLRSIAIIAEGIPENKTKMMIKEAERKGVFIIGPATVGGLKPGCFKIGNTGGMLDNIIESKLYRPGNVAYVSRSGGMSNELNNIISRTTNGVYEGVAIGGDRYPGSSFIDHIMRYNDNPNIKMIVLLGEVGGTEEYKIVEKLKDGTIKKPLVAWCIGTCSTAFTSDVQFGHAGSMANAAAETSVEKNRSLAEAGAVVPPNFDELDRVINETYEKLYEAGTIKEQEDMEPPKVPIDYSWAQELGLIRKPAAFVTTITDERGEELLYAGMPISAVFKEDIGIGGVLSLLWFKRRLPAYACKFIEMTLMVTADHGPAVSGAHNTIVASRAGKDLISSLCSGLLTIGDRFGGALDGAAQQFSTAYDAGMSPQQFVNTMRKQHKLIMGIGHKVKSINNPDMRVEIMRNYVKRTFPACPLLDFASEVEKITTAKKPNLILNVDGVIGIAFVDLLFNCGAFNPEEAQEYINMGTLNGLFVLGRTMGFIGHFLDQKRLKQGLYRHPWDDIAYSLPEYGNVEQA
eukprot:Clim_evm27s218 gene=Clim_evmTU27s218